METGYSNLSNLVNILLNQAGINKTPLRIEKIRRDGNNQVFRVDCKDESFILKNYFEHKGDNRDRLNTEFNFSRLTSVRTPGYTPKPYAINTFHSAALYEFIEGSPIISAEEVTATHITQAAKFISSLNTKNSESNYIDLSPASEACFSLQEHITRVDNRLLELINSSKIGENNLDFVKLINEIITKWDLIKKFIIHSCLSNPNLDLNAVLPKKDRILSPSDFGFHNAIVRPDKSVVFIDFEYAGWDDPAKLVGDFFSQVAIPINIDYLNLFMNTAFGEFENYSAISTRIHLLLSLYKIKWCCIVLNIFLPIHLTRRKFANSNIDIEEIKNNQLQKATKILKELQI